MKSISSYLHMFAQFKYNGKCQDTQSKQTTSYIDFNSVVQ